jgi:large conductance mechanosensitive channel
MGMIGEFKAFVQRGNVMDLAVGVIIGGAFGKIVTSLVDNVLMPAIGIAVGGVDFSELKARIGGTEAAPVFLGYGAFLQAVVDFLIVAFCVFVLVKAVSAINRPKPVADAAPAPPPTTPADIVLLTEIRDLLAKQRA